MTATGIMLLVIGIPVTALGLWRRRSASAAVRRPRTAPAASAMRRLAARDARPLWRLILRQPRPSKLMRLARIASPIAKQRRSRAISSAFA